MTEVEGGLAEPSELEPEQGSLRLADAADRWTTADWEKSAAAVLRKARRLGDDDPDALVWEKLGRTTLDDIAVTPLGTAALLDDLETSGRPTRAGDWDIRAHLTGPDAKLANEAALVDLNGGATSLWLELGAGLTPEDLDAALDGRAARPRAGRARRPRRPGRRRPGARGAARRPRASRPPTAPTWAPTRSRRGCEVVSTARPPSSTTEATLVAVAELARRAGTLGVVVDATAVHDLGASDAQELGYSLAVGAAYLRVLTAAGIAARRGPGPDRVPVRRHRRAVPDHRQAPRGPPALGPGGRAQRGAPRCRSASTP